jgi:hypothetical protein
MVITNIEQISFSWLTQIFQKRNLNGKIMAVHTEHLHGTWSKMYRIRPTYSAPNPHLPQSFLLKICAGDHGVFGPSVEWCVLEEDRDVGSRNCTKLWQPATISTALK